MSLEFDEESYQDRTVRFEGEIRVSGADLEEADGNLYAAVETMIGHTGAVLLTVEDLE